MASQYDWRKSYEWNYENAPLQLPKELEHAVPGAWDFCGLPVRSPLGVPAGPLLNSRWCLYYASLGFDVLTYKTVRTQRRDCYPVPNLMPVDARAINDSGGCVDAMEEMRKNWAVSFGMPSASPDVWRRDVEITRKELPSYKLLCVSIVGSDQPGWTLDDLAADYALAARWAVESGADCIEANFSCPNVSSCDGQLYLDASSAKIVAAAIRDMIGKRPLILKIGHIASDGQIDQLLDGVGKVATAFSMTNTIASRVRRGKGYAFDGQQRGISGAAIRDESVRQITRFTQAIKDRKLLSKTIGVGGIFTATDAKAYLEAGAHACHLATAIMLQPRVGLCIRESW